MKPETVGALILIGSAVLFFVGHRMYRTSKRKDREAKATYEENCLLLERFKGLSFKVVVRKKGGQQVVLESMLIKALCAAGATVLYPSRKETDRLVDGEVGGLESDVVLLHVIILEGEIPFLTLGKRRFYADLRLIQGNCIVDSDVVKSTDGGSLVEKIMCSVTRSLPKLTVDAEISA